MRSVFIALTAMGSFSILMGGIWNLLGSKIDDDVKKRSQRSWSEALSPPEDSPTRLKPLGDWNERFELFTLGSSVTTTKMGPRMWRWGVVATLVGLLGLLFS